MWEISEKDFLNGMLKYYVYYVPTSYYFGDMVSPQNALPVLMTAACDPQLR